MDMQKHLTYITDLIITELKSQKIRAVDALWKNEKNTACLSFYIDGEATEEELENAAVACAEIIAQCGNALLEENFIRWDYPKPLPKELSGYRKIENPFVNS